MRRFYKHTLCILEQLSARESALAPRAARPVHAASDSLRQLLAAVLLVCKDEHSCQVKYRNAEKIVRKSPAWAPDFGPSHLSSMLNAA
jgi:hypothetical protein